MSPSTCWEDVRYPLKALQFTPSEARCESEVLNTNDHYTQSAPTHQDQAALGGHLLDPSGVCQEEDGPPCEILKSHPWTKLLVLPGNSLSL